MHASSIDNPTILHRWRGLIRVAWLLIALIWCGVFVADLLLVYGTPTAILAAIYTGSVISLPTLLRPLLGGNDQITIVASTLAIASLFQPLRRRIQQVIARRFYRRTYDAATTLQTFSARLRDETDLMRLRGDLVSVIDDAVQPAHVSLWLRQPTGQGQP